MTKKVLIHAPNLSTPGGKQTYFRSIKEYFQNDVTFFFYGAQGKKENLIAFISRVIKDYRRFYRIVKQGNFDLVHLNPSLNPKSFFRDSIFVLICQWCGVKTIVFWRGWNVDFEQKVVRNSLPFFRFTYGKADSMILLAREFMDRIRDYGYDRPLFLSTTVVNDQIFNTTNGPKPENDKRKNGMVGITILFLARIERAKGIYETIDSFHQLLPKFQNVRLDIAGIGGELEPAKKYVAEKNIPGINFLGWITGEQKSKALSHAHIYVLASSHGEGMPNSLLEAMASGLAVVTTDVGGIKDFFQEGKMGFYVRPHDTSDLKDKLKKLLSDPDLIAQIGAFNTVYAREHFSPKLVTERLEKIYAQTISGIKTELIPKNEN